MILGFKFILRVNLTFKYAMEVQEDIKEAQEEALLL